MPQYILLLLEPPATNDAFSPEEMQAIIDRYKNWSAGLAAKGHLRGGHKLQDGTGRVLRRDGASLQVSDGPYAETKEQIAGFFLIEASSYDEAAAIARDCPHLDFGSIEVREIEPTP